MKHTSRILYLIIFCASHTTFAMESVELQQQTTNTLNIKTLNLISDKIDYEYAQGNEVSNFFTRLQLKKTDMLAIINLTDYWYKTTADFLNPSFIDALREKNTFFDEAINYFIKLARKNRDNVTCATINAIDNPASHQPVQLLNTIPREIKEYVMQQAYNEITLTYNMILAHPHKVRLLAVHPATDRAVTHSTDSQLRIWDLKTGSAITFQENNPIILIQFNQDGSLMATATHYTTRNNHTKSRIKIRKPLSEKPLHTITQDAHVYHINFMQGSSNNILAAFAQEHNNAFGRHDRILTLWQLNDIQEPIKLCSSSPLPWRQDQLTEFLSDKKKYEGSINDDDDTIVCIIKKRCVTLHLCKQAIENNTHLDTLNDIHATLPYQRLTEYEQQLINKDIAEQISQAKKNIPLFLALQRK